MCFALRDETRQIGFARVITDRATIAYLGDVFVLPEFRGKGLGKWLMECVMAHPELQGLRAWILVTRDAHDLYRPLGFKALARPEGYMELAKPERVWRHPAMNPTDIFQPFLATLLLTLVVWVYMYGRRLPFIFSSGLDPRQMTPLELARVSPPAVSNPSDNLKNLLELPTAFYAIVLYLHATGQVDTVHIAAAWVFFGFRALHSLVHCTFNLIPLRFALYVISAGALWVMVLRAAAAAFAGAA